MYPDSKTMNFKTITGHRHQLAHLDHMLETGMIPQAMLFTGMQGIGKAKIALHFFSALFCTGADKPCFACKNCIQTAKKTFPDLIELYPDEKGRIPLGSPDKKEPGSIRWLIERLSKKSVSGATGVIIDGADTISIEGQNALLKSIEEPQEETHIILIAANRSRLLPTIMSRCMVIPFNPLSTDDVLRTISENGTARTDLALIAAIAGGSLETAGVLMNREIMDKMIDLCGHISAYLNKMTPLSADPGAVIKEISADTFLTVMINIYRLILMKSIGRDADVVLPGELAVTDGDKVHKFIKILLALRKGLSNNLNIKISIKGMLYALERMDENARPEIPSILY